ncbi:MAG: hypothetical protein QOG54_2798 [Actinomycetota bacterium]|jgi:uncharacterized protein (TIGR03083 family)|nr:hypothetical protein [Actinomycetota bacterium]
MSEFGAAYEATRQRVIELTRDLDDEGLAIRVPATPEWTVKDLVAHVTGICTDILEGKYEGVGQDEWTRAQVEARRDLPLAEIVAEWDEQAPKVEEVLDTVFHPAVAAMTLSDLVTHEQDLRGALNAPGARDTRDFELALEADTRTVGRKLKKTELPALRVIAGDGLEWAIGNGEPQGEVKGDPFELFRTMGGRRTRDQARSLEWSIDPEPYIEIFCLYGYRDEPLHE